jgi:TetR/AcrR family transcriptional regulator, transcriptional repressor for nem operon
MGRPSTARQRLLETACREFARSGAQAVGVDELCRRAGINKGSFYHFFPSKADLILTCLEVSWDQLRTEVFEPAFAPDRTPRERIGEFFDRLINQQLKLKEENGTFGGCIFCTLGSEISHQEERVRAAVLGFMNRNIAFLTGAYAEALERDEGRPGEDPALLAENAYTLILGALVELKIRQELRPLERAKEAALGLLRRIT